MNYFQTVSAVVLGNLIWYLITVWSDRRQKRLSRARKLDFLK